MNRRSFIKLSGLLGIGLASTVAIPTYSEAVKYNRKLHKVSKTHLAMGTFVSMTLIHSSRDASEEAMGRAFEEMDRLNRLMNRFDESTAIAQLNSLGYLKEIPAEVAQVVESALYYHQVSHGAFDITVKPVVDLFKETFGKGKGATPSQNEIMKALSFVGTENIELKGRNITFKKPGMGITLDGIAKGYIVDRASQLLSDYGIDNHLINAGGDIRTRGEKENKRPWTVAIQDPLKKRNYPDIIKMKDGAVATSGNYEVYFDREKMFHHIVNPETGLSPALNTSVSVLAETAMAADALATGVFVMPPEEGIGFVNSLSRCESLVIAKDGVQVKSTGWKSEAI